MRTTGQTLHRLDGSTAEPVLALPVGDTLALGGSLDDTDSPRDVMDLLALAAFATGREPYAHTKVLDRVRADAELLPAGARIAREAVEGDQHVRLAVGEGFTLLVLHWRQTRRATVLATAVSAELAASIVERSTTGAVDAPPPSGTSVPIGFWHQSARGPRRVNRHIEAQGWDAIRGNYTASVVRAFDELMTLTAAAVHGRLLLLYGPPGTGKTTAVRALARQWRSWCQVDCVLDPETLFRDPAYLMDVALGVDEGSEAERWRLLLMEDCDELIRGDAKRETGQALSRLLNLTDGLLGQGRNVLIALTTNEDVAALHPAIVRPGRCMARVEVGALTREEALGWLGRPDTAVTGPATLAEMFALREGWAPVEVSRPEPAGGMYL
jgi:hypothetical protein